MSAVSSRDKDWGYFVPLKHFIFTPEGGHITPVFLHFRNTEPLLMQPTAPTEAVEAADAPARETELEGLPTTPAMSAVAFGALMAMAQASSPTALVAPAPPASPQATQTAGEDVSTVTPEGVQVVASGAQVPVASDRVRLLSDAVSDAAETQKPAVSADDLEETAALATVVADKMDVVHTSSADAADHSPGDGVVHEAELAGVEFAGKAVAGESKEDLDEDGDEEEDLRSTTTADELQQADQSNAISGKELPGGTESTVDNASLTVPVLATTEGTHVVRDILYYVWCRSSWYCSRNDGVVTDIAPRLPCNNTCDAIVFIVCIHTFVLWIHSDCVLHKEWHNGRSKPGSSHTRTRSHQWRWTGTGAAHKTRLIRPGLRHEGGVPAVALGTVAGTL